MELKLEKQSKQGSDNEKVAVAIMSDDEYVAINIAILQFYAKLNLSIATHLEKEEVDVERVKKLEFIFNKTIALKNAMLDMETTEQGYKVELTTMQATALLTVIKQMGLEPNKK